MQFRDNRSTLVAGMLVAIFVGISAETLTGGETAEAANGGVNFSNSSESVLIYRSASMPNEPIGPFRERQTYPTLHHWLIAQKSVRNCQGRDIVLLARNFSRSSGIEVEIGGHPTWGLGTIHNGPPYGPRMNSAEYDFTACAGTYRLEVEYAAAESRPVDIYVNGGLAIRDGLQATTGGWSAAEQRWLAQGEVRLVSGHNILQFRRDNYFPHILAFRLVPV
jgi:hypothetical protein